MVGMPGAHQLASHRIADPVSTGTTPQREALADQWATGAMGRHSLAGVLVERTKSLIQAVFH